MSAKKILIVEDEPTLRKTFGLLLQDRYKVSTVPSGRDALQRFRKAKLDLIITDLRLKEMSGLDLIERFRAAGYDGDVILVSGYPEEVDTQVLLDLSIGYFFAKPLDLDELYSAVEYLLDTHLWHEKRIASI
jgi:DNA-binding response OmpR family regulator